MTQGTKTGTFNNAALAMQWKVCADKAPKYKRAQNCSVFNGKKPGQAAH
jgi:hypothetical protein